jgi:hydroxyethylthiazole kinase-like uncharacterized protein yjeF
MSPLDELLAAHPLPDPSGGKDDSGTVVVIGGPPSCPGAALLAGSAALRTGSGRVQLVVDPTVCTSLAVALPEALVLPWDQAGGAPEDVLDRVATADVVVVGSGHREVAPDVVAEIVDAARRATVVLDAGALDACTQLAAEARFVVAPNPKEAEELIGPGDEASLATSLTAKLQRPVAVRGAVTVVADGDDAWVFDRAPLGLGTPGSGDVFVGILGGLLAGGLAPVGALGWAVELHASAAAELAAATPVGYLAHEIAGRIPHALAKVRAR